MSNGDDVLDNWEEIDEAGLNSVRKLKTSPVSSFERIVDNCYHNKHFSTSTAATVSSTIPTSPFHPTEMKLLQRSNAEESVASSSKPLTKSPLDNMSASFEPVMMVLHKPQDEYQSANYTAPIVNQTVKILRRPTQSTENRSNCIRPKQPIKTLQQREQEYAEARLRILGSAKNPEDEEELTSTETPVVATVTCSTLLITGANQCNNHVNQQVQQQQQQQQYLQNYQMQQQQQQQQPYFYSMQQQPQSPAYNNNRTYNVNPVLALGPMGAKGQSDQYHTTKLSSPQAQQQHFKYQQYHQKSPQQQNKSQQPQQQTWSPVVGGSVSSSSVRQQQQHQQQNDTILREPHGPDGTTGFQMRR